MPERRLGPAEHRVDAGTLPFAAGSLDRLADLAPVEAGRMGAVDHLVVLVGRPVGLLEERPGVVEQVGRKLATGGGIELGREIGRGGGHGGRVLRAELAEDVQDTLEPERPGLDPRPVVAEQAAAFRRVVGGEELADRLERDLEVAHGDDRPGRVELATGVRSIARLRVRAGGPKQVELVVVPQGADAQAGQPGEPSDGEQVIHDAMVDPRATRESSPLARPAAPGRRTRQAGERASRRTRARPAREWAPAARFRRFVAPRA
jgi:hypothetical protein